MATENGYHPGEKAASAIARLGAQAARESEEPAVIAGDAPVATEKRWTARVCVSDLSDLWRERNHLRAQCDDLQALNTRLTVEKRDAAAYGDAVLADYAALDKELAAAKRRVADLEAAVADWRKRHDADRDALDAAKRDADFLREQTREIRRALGAASAEHVVEAAKRVVRQRDDEASVAGTIKDAVHTLDDVRHAVCPADGETTVDAVLRVVAERDEATAKAQRERERGNEFLVQFHDATKRADAAERLAHEAEAQREAAARGLTIRRLVEQSHALSRSKGWYDNGDPNLGERLMLVVTEVAEAMEDDRRGRMTTTVRDDGKPEGFPSEIADIVIRIADMCGAMGIDLEAEIQRKHAFNATRPYRHGGKAA